MCSQDAHHEDRADENTALLHHMIHHNAHHTDEIRKLAESIETENSDASALLKKAVDCFEDGNKLLEQALSALKEN